MKAFAITLLLITLESDNYSSEIGLEDTQHNCQADEERIRIAAAITRMDCRGRAALYI